MLEEFEKATGVADNKLQAPESWNDLLNPVYKNQLQMPAPWRCAPRPTSLARAQPLINMDLLREKRKEQPRKAA